MSMLTRKGTMVRTKRGTVKKTSVGRTRSTGANTGTGSYRDQEDPGESPVTSTQVLTEDFSAKTYNALSQTAMQTVPTVVCFDENNHLYHTSVGWTSQTAPADQATTDLLLQIREARREAEGTRDFLCRFTDIFCNTLFVTICTFILMIGPAIMVSVGIKYLSECPRQPKIPVYLMVGGCFGVLKLSGMAYRNIQMRRYEGTDDFYGGHDADAAFASHTFKMMDGMLSAFLFGWQVAGTYWVFTIWKPSFTQLLHEPSNWCDATVYMCAVIQIIACYVLMCLGIVGLVLVGLCYKYTKIFSK